MMRSCYCPQLWYDLIAPVSRIACSPQPSEKLIQSMKRLNQKARPKTQPADIREFPYKIWKKLPAGL